MVGGIGSGDKSPPVGSRCKAPVGGLFPHTEAKAKCQISVYYSVY